MITVQRWTGREARALRMSLRMGVREFASRLGIAPSAVSRWEKLGEQTQLRPETQQMLDTVLEHASAEAQQRFTVEISEATTPTVSMTTPIPAAISGHEESLRRDAATSHTASDRFDGPPRADDQSAAVISANQGSWRDVRRYLNRRRPALGRGAVGLYPDEARVGATALITRGGWMPERPIDLERVELGWRAGDLSARVRGDEPEVGRLLPLRVPGKQFDRYTSAVRYVDPPSLFENRPSYRLLDVSWQQGAGRLDFGLATYFDKLDVCEALGHEYAAAAIGASDGGGPGWHQLPLRALVVDPFDLASRVVVPAVTTLTIRVDHGQPSFLLHWRDPTRVATAGGMYDVIPAGEFQPSSVGRWDRVNDFNLWRNIVREFSEELLGAPEHDGSRGAPIDYDRWPLYQRLQAARQERRLTVTCLGVGLDALTLAATIMTAVVIDGSVFDEIFGEVVRVNAEGRTVTADDRSRAAKGILFTDDTVNRMLEHQPLASPGAACLHLAWAHRHELLSGARAWYAGTLGGVTIGSTNTAPDHDDPTPTAAAWRAVRGYQRERRGELTQQAANLYPDLPRVDGTTLLTRTGWLPSEPIPLNELTPLPVTGPDAHQSREELVAAAADLLPKIGEHRAATYAEALAAIERPRLLVDRPTYRLVAADLTASPPSIRAASGTYYDVLNIGEAAGHEYATHHRAGRRPSLADLPLRNRIGDPTDPGGRPVLVAITTLTIRYDRRAHDARLLVHWRDPAKVATNGGAYQLAPVGMFQPAGEAGDRWMVDLDLWRCIAREYSEELLGEPEIEDVVYERWPFYLDLEQARADGTCRPYLLGLGADPLTFATDLLTVVVFEAATFDRIFAGLVTSNAEGEFETLGPDGLLGAQFDRDEITRLAAPARMQPAGAATLHLAWHHRHTLLSN
ncbi:MAG: hypothetical protein GEV12_08570 [Micromonosporaceae bacterium]|nr:hypothetical protein [Micromonosporaceae bacterium]